MKRQQDLNSSIKYLEEALLEEEYQFCQENLYYFYKKAWSEIDPEPYVETWVYELISEHLQAQQMGEKELQNIIINIQPRIGKSKLISVAYPAWIWTFRPQEKFLCVSHGDRLVTDLSTGSRNLMMSSWYSSHWVGENKSFQFARDSNTKTRYDNTKGGSRIGTTPSGQGLGFGYTTLIMDDPNDLMDIYSEAELKKVTDYYKGVLRNRANNPATAKKVLVQQRVGAGDLTAWIQENEGDRWFHLLIPSEFESKYTFISPIGLNDPRKKEGESVCPERFDEDFYYEEKKDAFKWASLYQQRPAPLEGAVIKNSWIRYAEKVPEVFDFMCISTDLALTDNDESDYCVFSVWGKKKSNIFLVDLIRDKMHINEQVQTLKDLSIKYPNARTKLIERRATGDPLMQMLENQISGLIGVNPIGKKIERLYSCVPEFASGKVFFPNPKEAIWVKDVLDELLVFPKSKHDDIVDVVSQAINYLALQSFNLEVTLSEQTDNCIAKHKELFTGFASNYSIPMSYTGNKNPFKQ